MFAQQRLYEFVMNVALGRIGESVSSVGYKGLAMRITDVAELCWKRIETVARKSLIWDPLELTCYTSRGNLDSRSD
jgi:hypothetical protein